LKRDAIRGAILGRHGRYQIVQIVRRGKPELRYVRDPGGTPCSS
jgi:hypothetical protein